MNRVARSAIALLAVTLAGCGGTFSVPEVDELPEGDEPAESAEGGLWASHTWPEGFTLEVAEPVPCDSDEGERVVRFEMTLENATDQSFEFGRTIIVDEALFDEEPVEPIYDIRSPCGSEDLGYTVIEPGEEHVFDMSYPVGEQPGEMVLEVSPTIGVERVELRGPA